MGNWSVRWKISSLILVSVALAAALGATALAGISRLATSSADQDQFRQATLTLARLDSMAGRINGMVNANLAFPDQTKTFLDGNTAYIKQGDAQMAELQAMPLGADDAAAVDDLEKSWRSYTDQSTALQRSLTATATKAQLYQGGETVYNVYDAFSKALGAVIESVQSKAEAAAADQDKLVTEVRWIVGLALATGLVLLAVFGWWIGRGILRPLAVAAAALRRVAERDYTVHVPVTGRDEIGRMSEAVNAAVGDIREAIGTIAGNAQSLSDASVRLTAISGDVNASSEQASGRAGTVSESSMLVNDRVREAAQGAEQMTAAIREIAGNTSQVAQIAQGAVETAQQTTAAMSKLSTSTDEIGNVIKLITSIAEQTNLLALNATIEAARAGESGKGFAVVASEVKDLAQSTARATEDIGQRIEAIQGDTTNAIEAIGRIADVINEINQYQASIAGAVEEQTATTNELSRLFDDAAHGADSINRSIEQVAATAAQTANGATSTRQAADELAGLAASLTDVVGRFKIKI
ncbi:methyl-accepting chemotaxis protein [Actinoplanes subglobosus]|uniref:Methyl-accepting chemotaxis protein n=1 Tax=Actinoplanes subglobosus TaxID=1547892 RepID=A0ABV8IZF5_9ACTN